MIQRFYSFAAVSKLLSLEKALKLLEGSINAPLMQQPGLALQFNVAAAKYKALSKLLEVKPSIYLLACCCHG